MKLISMTAFVLEQSNKLGTAEGGYISFSDNVINYANFLKTPLTLGMFVPCDEDGNVLEDIEWKNFRGKMEDFHSVANKFKQAKDKVLFDGFTSSYDELTHSGKLFWVGEFSGKETVENLIPSNLTLTETAIKTLNL